MRIRISKHSLKRTIERVSTEQIISSLLEPISSKGQVDVEWRLNQFPTKAFFSHKINSHSTIIVHVSYYPYVFDLCTYQFCKCKEN